MNTNRVDGPPSLTKMSLLSSVYTTRVPSADMAARYG